MGGGGDGGGGDGDGGDGDGGDGDGGDGDGDTAEKCRQARRRRIEMRQLVADAASTGERRWCEAAGEEHQSSAKRARVAVNIPPPLPVVAVKPVRAYSSASCSMRAVDRPVAFGSVALAGRMREMEDAVSVRPGFFRSTGGSPLHFFGVFDGHGGSHVSDLCKQRMHQLLAEELAATAEVEMRCWAAAVGRSFTRMDEVALMTCACGNIQQQSCHCERSGIKSDIVGSTAVVAVVSGESILIANCGDSRAVLSRSGKAVPLSSDHKPDRPDELARIEAVGGKVIYQNGARVNGILAMSRALGDRYLKPVVISEPEIQTVGRTSEDDCLIIASDGLWDVLPNALACDVARRCLAEESPTRVVKDVNVGVEIEGEEQASDARCSIAAMLLARLAMGRNSRDNISVIVVDLRSG